MIAFKAKLKKVTPMKTETKFTFSTKDELDELQLAQFEGSIGFLAFNQDEISKRAMEVMKDRKFGVKDDGMTPSQKLRGHIWKLWNEKFSDKYTDEEFYLSWMNHFNNEIEKLLQ